MRYLHAYTASALLLIATLFVARAEWVPFLSDANLIFHEAGHAVLFWSPDMAHVLSGTLMQLSVSLVCLVAFFRQRKRASASLMLWWLGQNMVNVGWYMADARAQALPLLGGDAVGHDWTYLFGQWGLLQHDTLIGGAVEVLGVTLMLVAVVWLWHSLATLSTPNVENGTKRQ